LTQFANTGSGLLALVHVTGGNLVCGVERLQRPLNHFFHVFIVATLQLFIDEPFGVGFEREGMSNAANSKK
jgi:hypothetical protein